MEIVGIGTDIVEVVRIGRLIQEHGELFLTRVYTAREIRYCQARKNAKEHSAGRWAAKEAILKCLGTGWRKGLDWTDLEIRNDFQGAPKVYVSGEARDQAAQLHVTDILLTLSHCRAFATATAIAVTGTAPHIFCEE
jgi:holo-[acyl-carrier protein] synthase